MHRRSRVITATMFSVIGVTLLVFSQLGGGQLEAATIAQTGYNWAKIMVWSGAGLLMVSALLFISANAE